MKIIDLLNKIANGEEVPKRIKYDGIIYEKKSDYNNKYYDVEDDIREKDLLSEYLASKNFYNDEVEILEEEKKIPEKLDKYADISGNLACEWSFAEKKLKDKINEIIDYLKSKGE